MDFAAVDIMTLNETFGKKVRIPFATEVKIPVLSLLLVPIQYWNPNFVGIQTKSKTDTK
jgi:hypothetical protein